METSPSELAFPAPATVDPANVSGGFAWQTIEPSAAPALAFGIALPLGWGMEPDPGKKPQFPGEVVQLRLFGEGRQSQNSIVQVSYTVVECDLHLYDWLNLTAKAFSVQPMQWRVARGPTNREIVHMLGLAGPENDRYVARVLCLADSGRIVLVMAMTPASRYAEMADTFATILGSFALARPANPGQLERWSVAAAKSPDFRMLYPASWTVRHPPFTIPGKTFLEIVLPTDDDLAAYVRVKAIDPKIVADDAARTLEVAIEELTETPNVQIESIWQDDNDPLLSEIPDLLAARHAFGRLSKGVVEFRVAVAQRGGLTFCGTLLTVVPDYAPAEWARARFAFNLALGSATTDPNAYGGAEPS